VVPGLLIVGTAAAAGALVYRPSPAGPASTTAAVLQTPIISPRRLPAALSTLVADGRLAARLDSILTDPSLGPTTTASCMTVRVGGQAIYARRPASPLLPASNAKLLIGEAALTRLGTDSHFTTSAVAARPMVNGVISGPLWLVGGGDPLLITNGFRSSQTEFTWSREPGSHLEDLADRIKAAGVRAISGGVIGDDTRYDGQRSIPTWKSTYLADGEIGAVGALVVDAGFVSSAHHAPAPSPAAAAAGALSALLQQRGITVGSSAGSGAAPSGATTVAALDSLPLPEIVKVMLLESDNLAAEMLVKELGHRFGSGGSWTSGLDVLKATLAQGGLPLAGLVLVDGSGLDRGDRATCGLLVETVEAPGAVGATLRAGLPLAGQVGTLVHRLVGQPAAGRLRAKTGSLSGVAALTGFIDPPKGQATPTPAPAFALLGNQLSSDAAGRAFEDRVADALATYPDAPRPETLGPP
jgi:D-alanyl-D-alanine carboxypeptidase/D-alanyl-D-alanine-endopeptidase (penicillin-binding protein 4)